MNAPELRIERVGPSYAVDVPDLDARLTFRDVRTDRELSADISVNVADVHVLRTSTALGLIGRDRLARTVAELAGNASPDLWRRAVFAAVEAVLDAEERLGGAVDLRRSSCELPGGVIHVAAPFWPVGSLYVIAPGAAGKSTIMRAVAVSIAAGRPVIPGIEPVGPPRPVLYVAGEDPVHTWHARSIEAICRGAGIDRATIAQPIELFDTRGRPLHRIARAIAERAAGFGAVILDSQQSMAAQPDATGNIRDRDSLFWNAVDQSPTPTAIVAHPNRADAREWTRSDGRAAGSEVNRDRARMAWRVTWKDEPAVAGTSYRRYTLENAKNSHGPKLPPLAFGAGWTFGAGSDPGTLAFSPAEPVTEPARDLTDTERRTIEAIEAGNVTPAALGVALGIPTDTAKKRMQRLRERGILPEENDG